MANKKSLLQALACKIEKKDIQILDLECQKAEVEDSRRQYCTATYFFLALFVCAAGGVTTYAVLYHEQGSASTGADGKADASGSTASTSGSGDGEKVKLEQKVQQLEQKIENAKANTVALQTKVSKFTKVNSIWKSMVEGEIKGFGVGFEIEVSRETPNGIPKGKKAKIVKIADSVCGILVFIKLGISVNDVCFWRIRGQNSLRSLETRRNVKSDI